MCEAPMVEDAVTAGRCTPVPLGFGSWPPPVYVCFFAGMGIALRWCSIRLLGAGLASFLQ